MMMRRRMVMMMVHHDQPWSRFSLRYIFWNAGGLGWSIGKLEYLTSGSHWHRWEQVTNVIISIITLIQKSIQESHPEKSRRKSPKWPWASRKVIQKSHQSDHEHHSDPEVGWTQMSHGKAPGKEGWLSNALELAQTNLKIVSGVSRDAYCVHQDYICAPLWGSSAPYINYI